MGAPFFNRGRIKWALPSGHGVESIQPLLSAVRAPFRAGRKNVVLAGAAMVGVTVTKVLLPWPLKMLFDYVLSRGNRPWPGWLPREPLAALAVLCLSLVVLYVLKGWFFYQEQIQSSRAGRRLILGMRASLFDKILSLPMVFHSGRKTGEILARLVTDVNQIKDLILGVGLQFFGEIVTVLAMLAVLLVHDPILALAAVVALPVMFLPSLRFSTAIRTAAREQRRRQGELVGNINETLRSIRVVQAFGRQDLHRKVFSGKDAENIEAEVKMSRFQANLVRTVEAGVAIGSALVMWVGTRKVMSGEITAGDLIVFTSYLKSMYRPLQDVARLSSRYNKAVASAERISEILASENTIVDPAAPRPLIRARGDVEFRNVTFEYEPGCPVIRNASFRIAPGECVALLGPSGIGKSTLSYLLMRFHDPQSGEVRLDGQDVRNYRVVDLRRQIAVVFQDPFLFGVSLRDNIAYGRPDATEEEIRAAARMAQVDEFAVLLPQGYDTLLAEQGSTLSAGQKQRVSIARALLKDAPILVLDEPMTGLDHHREYQVQEALQELQRGRTTILITHNQRAAAEADRIMRLEHGFMTEAAAAWVDSEDWTAADGRLSGGTRGTRRLNDPVGRAAPGANEEVL